MAAAGNEARNNDTLRWYQRGLPDGPSYPASYDLAGFDLGGGEQQRRSLRTVLQRGG